MHLDSPFEGLGAGKASVRRGEQRELLRALAELAVSESVDLVLLAGDLLDGDGVYQETAQELVRSLAAIPVPVFIAPGNHDFFAPSTRYAKLKFSDNVHIFKKSTIECVELPSLHARVYGAAFTEKHSSSLLAGFRAEKTEGVYELLCLHGELGVRESLYDPIDVEELSRSGLDYAALGHVHKASGLQKAGNTWYSWPGCPEGRGFDETGEKTVSIVELRDGDCTLRPVCIAKRRYESIEVNVTGIDPLLAIHTQLPDDTVRDIYRITLTGETDTPPDLNALRRSLGEMFFELRLRDETHLRRSIWDSVSDDTLRGVFLTKLRKKYDDARTDSERSLIEQAVRWGLAAMDRGEEVVSHEDK